MQGFEFCCPTKIVCGAHALDKLPDEVADRGMKHPLVMTDAGLVKLGVAAKLTGVLDAADVPYEVFDQVPPDSSMDVVNEVARLYADRGCDGFVPSAAARSSTRRRARPRRWPARAWTSPRCKARRF